MKIDFTSHSWIHSRDEWKVMLLTSGNQLNQRLKHTVLLKCISQSCWGPNIDFLPGIVMQMLNVLSPPNIDCTSIVLYKAFMFLTPKAIISAHFYAISPTLQHNCRVWVCCRPAMKSISIEEMLICRPGPNANSPLHKCAGTDLFKVKDLMDAVLCVH